MKHLPVLVLLLFLQLSSYAIGQENALLITKVSSSYRLVRPVVFYSDTVTKEYMKQHMMLLRSVENYDYNNRVKLSDSIDYSNLFFALKNANISFVDTTKFRYSPKRISKAYLTNGMRIQDSILFESPFEIEQTLLVFLDYCRANYSTAEFSQIHTGIESILWHFKPKYYEIVEEKK